MVEEHDTGTDEVKKYFQRFRSGLYGRRTSVGAGLLVASLVFAAWRSGVTVETLLTSAQRLAFVGTGFVVAAFNLRFKIMDTIKDDSVDFKTLKRTHSKVEACTRNLSVLIGFFVLLSACMAAAPLFGGNEGFGVVVAAGCYALLAVGLIQFLMILFTFDELESFALRKIRAKKAKAERDELDSEG